MAKLLVSVRSAGEARTALNGGVDLIDLKEPGNGSLGRVADATVRSVIQLVRSRVPVSAAMGELEAGSRNFSEIGLAYAKWGLANLGRDRGWRSTLRRAATCLRKQSPGCEPVAVAYADWQIARSPDPLEVCRFACQEGWPAFLLDTWRKDGGTLLDHLHFAKIDELCQRCRDSGVRPALAGSLGEKEIDRLRSIDPTWFAVRTAVCADGRRDGAVDPCRIRHLVKFVKGWQPAAMSGS